MSCTSVATATAPETPRLMGRACNDGRLPMRDLTQAKTEAALGAASVLRPAPQSGAIVVAVALMTEYGLHNLPVVDDERPVGVVQLRKAVRHVSRRSGIGLGF